MSTTILLFALLAQAASTAGSVQAPPPTSPARAAQTVAPKPLPPGEDWVALFIGKEKWEIEDGTLHGVAVTREYGYLQTDKSYKDFQLSLRFKCEGDGNSGV